MNEIESIKERLAKDLCPQSMQTLMRAILVPEEVEYIPKMFDPKVEDDGKPKKGKKKKKGKKGEKDKGKPKKAEPEPVKKEEKDENAQEFRKYPRIIESLMVNPFPKKKKKGKKKKGKK